MSVQHIFTTPIAEYSWDRNPETLVKLKQQIADKNLNFPFNSSPEMLEFTDWILTNTQRYAYNINKNSGYILLRDMWHRTMTEKDSYVPPHIHPSVWCIGTFYFDDEQGDLVLLDPRGAHDFELNEVIDTDGNTHSNCVDYYHKPKANSCVMFPSYIKHLVLPSKNDKRSRTAISWNILYNQEDVLLKIFNPPQHLYRKL